MFKISNYKEIDLSKEEVKDIIADYIYNEIKNNPDYKLDRYLITGVYVNVFGGAEVKLSDALGGGKND